MIFPSVWFLLLYASNGTVPPYLSLHYREEVGLSTQQIGYLFAISPFVSFVAATFWTAVADKCNRHRTILVLLNLLSATTYILLGTVKDFTGLMLLTMVNSFFGGPVGAFVDIYALDALGPSRAAMYGKLRMIGTVAYGCSTFLTGVVVEKASHGNYTIAFVMYGIVQAAFIITVAFSPWRKPVPFKSLPALRRASQEIITASVDLLTKDRVEFEHRMYALFCNRSMMVFLATSILHGMARNIMGSYLFIFLSEYMHSAPILLGMSSPFSIGLEAPCFFFSTVFLTRLGFRKMIYLSIAAILVRGGAYTLLSLYAVPVIADEVEGWKYAPIILLVELTQGIAFAQFWSAGIHYMNVVSPDDLKTTSQGVFNGVSGGLATGIGNIIGGVLLETGGPVRMFQSVLVFVAVTATVFSGIGKLPAVVEEQMVTSNGKNGGGGKYGSVEEQRTMLRTAPMDDSAERVLSTSDTTVSSGNESTENVSH